MRQSILILIGLILTVYSCKKGENDPFLSLRSRKARIAGVYEYKAHIEKRTAESSIGVYNEKSLLEDGIIKKSKSLINSEGILISSSTSLIRLDKGEILFEKDGVYERIWNTTEIEVKKDANNDSTVTVTYIKTIEQSGSWNFLGKVDDYKNKERIILNLLSEKNTNVTKKVTKYANVSEEFFQEFFQNESYVYADGYSSEVYQIDMLKNKEMKFFLENNYFQSGLLTTNGEQQLDPENLWFSGTSEISFDLVEK